MKTSKRFIGLLILLCFSATSCKKCTICEQVRSPLNDGKAEVFNEEEICGRKNINAKKHHSNDSVRFAGDTLLYSTWWTCQ